MYVLKRASDRDAKDATHNDHVPVREAAREGGSEQLQIVIYLDLRAFTRDCVGGWLQSSLSGFSVRVLQDPDLLEGTARIDHQIRAVIINAGPERISSSTVARMLSRIGENIREAFNLGVRGYISTSLASLVAVEAVRMVCVGGTFAPATVLLSQSERPRDSTGESLIEGFTQRQSQILDCLRRCIRNKLIAYEAEHV